MLRFDEQQEFEAWLRRCPLPSKALAYAVSRTGDDSCLTVECRWKLPGSPVTANGGEPPAEVQLVQGKLQPATRLAAELPTVVRAGSGTCGEGAGPAAEGAGSDAGGGGTGDSTGDSTGGGAGGGAGAGSAGADVGTGVGAGAGAAPSMGEGDASAQIASLQGGLGAMKTMLASGGISADVLAAMMRPSGGGGLAAMTNPGEGAGSGGGGGGGGGGGAALAAMLLQQRAAMGDGPGAPPRTDPESIRAVLELCQGFSCPKPPGAG